MEIEYILRKCYTVSIKSIVVETQHNNMSYKTQCRREIMNLYLLTVSSVSTYQKLCT